MDPGFIPSPDKIPVNWLWFHVLLLLTFLLHIIMVNFILGGSLLTVWDALKGKTIKSHSKSIPTLIALTINFGVPPLLFVQVLYGHFFYTSSIIIAVPWILVIPILILAYYGAYIFVDKVESKKWLSQTSLIISSLILLIIAFIYVNNITLSMTPEKFVNYFGNTTGWNLNLNEPTLIPRYLHFITASIAIAGLGKAAYHKFGKNNDDIKNQKVIRSGLRIFAFATMAQVVFGILFWLTLPKDIYMLFMGRDLIFTILLMTAILLTFIVIFFAVRNRFYQTLFTVIPILIIMVLVRDFVRRSYLADVFRPQDLEMDYQPGSLILFLTVFIVGLLFLYYMIRLMQTSKTSQS